MQEILHIINEMSPYLLLGFFIAGLLHAFVPGNFYTRYLSKRSFRSVLNAALLGIPLPLCSCSVIPTAMSLRKEGASKGAVTSFLIATPQTGVDSIFATFSLMGLPFAITRPIVALFTAIFGGSLVNAVDDDTHDATEEAAACCHHHETEEATPSCCCHHHEAEHHNCCHHHGEGEHDCCHHAEVEAGMGFWEKMGVALRYAFVDMMDDIGKWLVIGLVIAGLITVFVPNEFFAIFVDNTFLSMLLVLAISIPMYVCATGSIPIAVALMMKGLTPGAALVLLMAGPAANMASILVIRQRLGTRTLIAYLVSIIGGAVAAGCIIDFLLPRTWFTSALVAQEACCESAGSWLEWSCTALLALLLLHALWRHLAQKG